MIWYRSKKDPTLIITSNGEIDPKFKTVAVQYPDGKIKILSSSTLTNQWEMVEQNIDMPLISVKRITPKKRKAKPLF